MKKYLNNKDYMKINVASSHRFHLLDLARELTKQGHDVRFYSYVPRKRCASFGLDINNCVCLLPYVVIFLAFERMFPKCSWLRKWRNRTLDFIMGHFMRRCDVYIGLGTVYLNSFTLAKKRFGAKTILEWGSKHIDDQQSILKELNADLNEEYFNLRSRRAYDVVDYISVASIHVVESFLKHDIPKEKILRNPYGVDLSMFVIDHSAKKTYDVIMVGGWSLRKGCDLIAEVVKKRSGLRFLHVGSKVDLDFPSAPNFTHIDSVNQPELNKYYNQAKVFLLPSREEGLAMVQAQAIACNLPLIGSHDSGANDLKQMVQYPEYITIIKDYTVAAVADAIKEALANYEKLGDMIYAGDAIENLTWEAYGKRYADLLHKIVTNE